MSDGTRLSEPRRRRLPLWRQAASGIGLVVAVAAVVCVAGLVLSVVVSWLFN